MRLTLRSLAALLDYPSAELTANVGEIREVFDREQTLPSASRQGLEPLMSELEADDLLDLQARYSELFDRSRALSLHLFEHVHGDSRERGPALIDLARQYMDRGLMLDSRELPDFVPVFLEFASCLPAREAREMLGQPAHVFAALEERLQERNSHYAAIFHALNAIAGAQLDCEALKELQENAPVDDIARIDQEWEEPPVTFNASHGMGGPTGVVAKIRAAARSMTGARRDGGRS